MPAISKVTMFFCLFFTLIGLPVSALPLKAASSLPDLISLSPTLPQILGCGFLLILGIVIIFYLRYRQIQTIRTLRRHAERVADGDFNPRVPLQHHNELGRLAEAFNRMADAMEERTQALTRTNRELKDQDARKTRFLDVVAHDLRTPLTSIKAYSELLLRYPDESPETQREFLNIIQKESDRMAALINDYLDLTKLESGILSYHFRKVKLDDMIHESVRVHQAECRLKEMEIIPMIDGPLPPLRADPDRLNQVFTNLIHNAIHHSPPKGKITISASVKEENGNTWIEVAVADEGPGIPEEYHGMIFDKFRQIDTTKLPTKGGVGLGLPISKEILRRHQGTIRVDPDNQRGACFRFRLPLSFSD
ncbi:MAG: HAMP domain-containing histidine kinase [Deltaproteobacteria bacterium]|nr:HAMP domain-containing histidine kinase [Deltaproteobacteria bacterium]